MEFLYELGLFSAKALVLVVAILVVVIGAIAASQRHKGDKGELSVVDMSQGLKELSNHINEQILPKKAFKALQKKQKAEAKAKDDSEEGESRCFVIDFKAGIDAAEVANLRQEVTAILAVAKAGDQVLVKVESGGGVVHGYGLAASQLARIRDAELELTVAIDKVAASGGYMMACVANRIIAAPFAIVGSIGVVAQLPNFNRLLKKHDIDFEQHTAGDYKRTLTLFGENTDEGRAKFQQEIEQTHELFKGFVNQYRPQLVLDKVATGEHWFGQQALELELVDELTTSDNWLMQKAKELPVFRVEYKQKKSLSERFALAASKGVTQVWSEISTRWPGKS
ncbi:protease SohB [Paraferrimonas sedimenticola]|uniref:Protease SohB n=1 Tax=Paraferrimonas sedimenticola TaxID=375674 RepID=A0AA37VSR8_9GAMM|nr:protease SohB [Paraferrimonas sedimenticola]GLP94916.1 protease SohB [Paraferrimonas sedimenticola]